MNYYFDFFFDMVLNQKCDTDCIKVRIKLYSKKIYFQHFPQKKWNK